MRCVYKTVFPHITRTMKKSSTIVSSVYYIVLNGVMYYLSVTSLWRIAYCAFWCFQWCDCCIFYITDIVNKYLLTYLMTIIARQNLQSLLILFAGSLTTQFLFGLQPEVSVETAEVRSHLDWGIMVLPQFYLWESYIIKFNLIL